MIIRFETKFVQFQNRAFWGTQYELSPTMYR